MALFLLYIQVCMGQESKDGSLIRHNMTSSDISVHFSNSSGKKATYYPTTLAIHAIKHVLTHVLFECRVHSACASQAGQWLPSSVGESCWVSPVGFRLTGS